MELIEDETLQQLLEEDEEFRKAYEMHRAYGKKVDKLNKRPYLAESDREEKQRLKKLKLIAKDKMEEILLRHREGRNDSVQ